MFQLDMVNIIIAGGHVVHHVKLNTQAGAS